METSKEELDKLIPPSDAEEILKRMPREERLPKYRTNGMPIGTKQIPQAWIDAIEKIGLIDP